MRFSSGLVLFYICSLISLILSLQFTNPMGSQQHRSRNNPYIGLSHPHQDRRSFELIPYQGRGKSKYRGNGIDKRSANFSYDSVSLSQLPDMTVPSGSMMVATTEISNSELSMDDSSEIEINTSIESPLLDMELDESSNEVIPYYYPYPYPYYYPTGSEFGVPVPNYNLGLDGQGQGQNQGPPRPHPHQSGNGQGQNQNQGHNHNQGHSHNQGHKHNQDQLQTTTTEQPEEETTTTENPTTTLAPFKLADVKIPTPFLRIELMICFTILGAIYGFGFMVLFQSLCVPAAKIAVFVVYVILLKLKAIQPVSLAQALEQLPPT
ncbi:unnamed protein product [Orchesella dallaii]|uniref:Uncharacterized protein n=1 Tax=Orchesella dallaii TaxID=48710 RepID=A0ABP1QW50_9HEXA